MKNDANKSRLFYQAAESNHAAVSSRADTAEPSVKLHDMIVRRKLSRGAGDKASEKLVAKQIEKETKSLLQREGEQ